MVARDASARSVVAVDGGCAFANRGPPISNGQWTLVAAGIISAFQEYGPVHTIHHRYHR